MVLPGGELKANVKYIGMRDGNIVVNVQTVNQRGEKVLEGTAEVAQPSTVYVFTGQAIRQPYMNMTYDTMDKDGNVKTLPLFGDINVRTQPYTFSHPAGLLFVTQFAQIALVVTERAAFEDMRSKGFVQKDSVRSAGHYEAW